MTDMTDTKIDRDGRIRFMEITPETGEHLHEFWKEVEPELPGILEAFYKHASAVPNLAKRVGDQVPRLKAAQKAHWERLFSGRFDDGSIRTNEPVPAPIDSISIGVRPGMKRSAMEISAAIYQQT